MSRAQVLIVDDDPALLEALPEALRLRIDDLDVDTSDSGQDALERLAETDYDALVVDIKMPGMDGLELLTEIKRVCPETPTKRAAGSARLQALCFHQCFMHLRMSRRSSTALEPSTAPSVLASLKHRRKGEFTVGCAALPPFVLNDAGPWILADLLYAAQCRRADQP